MPGTVTPLPYTSSWRGRDKLILCWWIADSVKILIMHFFLLYVFCLNIIIVIIMIIFLDTQRFLWPNEFETNNKLNRFIPENIYTF
jgi:hypothetical protein